MCIRDRPRIVAEFGFHQTGDMPQHFVAGGVTCGIVDQFEIVQIDIQQADIAVVACQYEAGLFFERIAIEQACQWVAGGAHMQQMCIRDRWKPWLPILPA